jgi:hypothetical protein
LPAAVAPTITNGHHPASASRPASVIISQMTLIGCRPARWG